MSALPCPRLTPDARRLTPAFSRCSCAAGGSVKGSKKKAIPKLQRPIICICNDLQSPNIRALKQVTASSKSKEGGRRPLFRPASHSRPVLPREDCLRAALQAVGLKGAGPAPGANLHSQARGSGALDIVSPERADRRRCALLHQHAAVSLPPKPRAARQGAASLWRLFLEPPTSGAGGLVPFLSFSLSPPPFPPVFLFLLLHGCSRLRRGRARASCAIHFPCRPKSPRCSSEAAASGAKTALSTRGPSGPSCSTCRGSSRPVA